MSRVHKCGSKLVNFEGYLQIKLTIKDFKNHFFLLLGLVLNDFHHKIQCIIFFVLTHKFRQCDILGVCYVIYDTSRIFPAPGLPGNYESLGWGDAGRATKGGLEHYEVILSPLHWSIGR